MASLAGEAVAVIDGVGGGGVGKELEEMEMGEDGFWGVLSKKREGETRRKVAVEFGSTSLEVTALALPHYDTRDTPAITDDLYMARHPRERAVACSRV